MIKYVFVHACETCCGHSTLLLRGKWEKFELLSLVYESMGHTKINIWNQERMYGFIDQLLLKSWTKIIEGVVIA